jgi:alkane 1-monooxygenase
MSTASYGEAATSAPAWKDKKRYLWMLGLVIPVTPLIGLALQHETGWSGWLWLTPLMFFAVIPLLDLVAGYDDTNPPE